MPLALNAAFVARASTGVNTYATELVPRLAELDPTVFAPEPLGASRWVRTSPRLTASAGRRGHVARLAWTEAVLPLHLRARGNPLLFSLIPEAPLGLRTRSVVMLHDVIPLRFPRSTWLLTQYYRHVLPRVLREAQHVLANSEATARDAVQWLALDPRKVTVTPLGYDAARFRFRDLPTDPYFLFVGRRDPHKNLERLIGAFARLGRTDLELRLAGPGDPARTAALRALAEQLGVAARVKFLDYLPAAELDQQLGRALALAFVSEWEGFGLPVLEAMASGTPVICSDASSLPEVAGDAALRVHPKSEAAIAEALRAVADDAGLRAELRRKGLARAAQFGWERTARETAAVLHRFM